MLPRLRHARPTGLHNYAMRCDAGEGQVLVEGVFDSRQSRPKVNERDGESENDATDYDTHCLVLFVGGGWRKAHPPPYLRAVYQADAETD